MEINTINKKICNWTFTSNNPNYLIIDNLFEPHLIKECSEEFKRIPESDFIKYQNPFFENGKYALNSIDKMPSKIQELFTYIHSQEFINLIQEITGISDLEVDEKRWGGGLHMTKKDGYLAVHKDFNILPTSYHDEKQMLRCINLIGYLNPHWSKKDGGELEFWDETGEKSLVSIEPKFNRWVLFDTRNNYHGHPHPFKGESPRISIASYYYMRTNVVEEKWMSTEYLRLPWMQDSEEYQKLRKERADHKLRYSGILEKPKN